MNDPTTDDPTHELIVWMTGEARALARLLTPRVLLMALAAAIAAWLFVRLVSWAVDMVWRLGGDGRRRLRSLVPASRIVSSATIAYLLLVGSFRAAPVVTVLLTVIVTMVLLVTFSGQLRSAYVGLGIAWQRRILPGDRFELDGHAGIVKHFGLLRIELKGDDGAAVHVPNRLLEDGIVRIRSVKNTSDVHLRMDLGVLLADRDAPSLDRIRRLAMISPYRVAGSPVSVSLDNGTLDVAISVWGEPAKAAALRHLERAIRRQLAP
jgi:hypothetical protein